MQRTSWIRSSLLAVAVGLALATPAKAATPDAWITTKTKLALLTTEGVSGTAMQGGHRRRTGHLAWQGGHHGGKDAR